MHELEKALLSALRSMVAAQGQPFDHADRRAAMEQARATIARVEEADTSFSLSSRRGPINFDSHLTDQEACEILQAEHQRSEFASSILRSATNGRSLSEKQRGWLHKLALDAQTPLTGPTLSCPNIGALFAAAYRAAEDKAARSGKMRKRFILHFGTLRLARAGERSTRTGSIACSTDEGAYADRTWLGFISPTGEIDPNSPLGGSQGTGSNGWYEERIEELRAIEADPAGAARAYGKEHGRCTFCSAELTDPRSTAVGYGPECASNWGLPWGASEPEDERLPEQAARQIEVSAGWSPMHGVAEAPYLPASPEDAEAKVANEEQAEDPEAELAALEGAAGYAEPTKRRAVPQVEPPWKYELAPVGVPSSGACQRAEERWLRCPDCQGEHCAPEPYSEALNAQAEADGEDQAAVPTGGEDDLARRERLSAPSHPSLAERALFGSLPTDQAAVPFQTEREVLQAAREPDAPSSLGARLAALAAAHNKHKPDDDRPERGKVYRLTGKADEPSIARGDSWAESEGIWS